MDAVIHPDGNHVIVFSNQMHVACFTIYDLEQVSEFQALPSDDGSLTSMALDRTGSNLLVTESRNMNLEKSIAKVDLIFLRKPDLNHHPYFLLD